MAKLTIEGNVIDVFIRQEIAIIKKCEKAIYDHRRYHSDWGEWNGLTQALYILYRKRKRLEAELK